MKISVCTESTSCEANHTIFENVLLPKQPCDWNEGFVNSSKRFFKFFIYYISKLTFLGNFVIQLLVFNHVHIYLYTIDFSGSVWMRNKGYTTPLTKYQSAELMREMKALHYLMAESCSHENEMYSHLKDGFNSCKNAYTLVIIHFSCNHFSDRYTR